MEAKRASGSSDNPRITARRTQAGTRASLGGSWMGEGSRPARSSGAVTFAGADRSAFAARESSSGSKGRWL
ncbi:hypothetical protein MYXA107069_33640 [Myxococcus xanthus]